MSRMIRSMHVPLALGLNLGQHQARIPVVSVC